MKKLIVTALTLMTCGAAYALPLGNPSEASLLCDGLFYEGPCYDFCEVGVGWCDALSFRLGYYGDFVFDRHLEVDDASVGDDIENTEMFTNAAIIVANVFDKIDLFTTFGATNFYINSNAATFGVVGTRRFELESETEFSWSVGLRGTVYECGCTSFGVEGQYFYTKPHITRVTTGDNESIYPGNNINFTYREWQLGFGMSHRVWNLVPYIGAKISGVKVDFGNAQFEETGTFLHDLHNRFLGGYVLGVSLVDCEKMALTVEGRFPDEKAVHARGEIRF